MLLEHMGTDIKVRIRPYKDMDKDRIFSWINDEEVFYLWSAGVLGGYPLSEEGFQKTAEIMRFTALYDIEPCGFFTARNPHESADELRLGFVLIDPDKRGKGIGSEMMRKALRFCFEIYGAECVSIAVFEDNTAAYRCYLRAGFVPTGNREIYRINGRERVAVELECSKRDFMVS